MSSIGQWGAIQFEVFMEYLVNISKRRSLWSLNEDILKITILTTNTLYPSRKIRRIHQGRYGVSIPALTKDHKGNKSNMLYPGKAILRIQAICEYNILEDIKRSTYSKKLQYAVSNTLDMPYRHRLQTP
ncbi:hypothetical protein Tco_0893847 [Tanacetum coccineum]|uniref:Uncharacterized protein n=1 Tax=Tanacetum coccineum TaxID=301880 RepID=A0ABQ5CA55_9ASTR